MFYLKVILQGGKIESWLSNRTGSPGDLSSISSCPTQILANILKRKNAYQVGRSQCRDFALMLCAFSVGFFTMLGAVPV